VGPSCGVDLSRRSSESEVGSRSAEPQAPKERLVRRSLGEDGSPKRVECIRLLDFFQDSSSLFLLRNISTIPGPNAHSITAMPPVMP